MVAAREFQSHKLFHDLNQEPMNKLQVITKNGSSSSNKNKSNNKPDITHFQEMIKQEHEQE